MKNKITLSGFTIIELMISITILAVLAFVGVPSMSNLFESNRIQTATDKIFSSLVAARSEAISRNHDVVMCKSSDGAACDASGDWEDGWLVFADVDGDGSLDVGEAVTLVNASFQNNVTIRTGANYAARVIYKSDGSVSLDDTFRVCGHYQDPNDAKSLVVTATGRPRTSNGAPCP